MELRERRGWIAAAAGLLAAACSSNPSGSGDADELAGETVDEVITISSPAFADGEPVPAEYSCDGDDVSPPLEWAGVPGGAAELAVVVDDPDAPHGTYVHWVLFGLDPSLTALDRGDTPTGAREAENSAGDAAYKGPCPPEGKAHHYRFTVYALGRHVDVADDADTADVLDALAAAAIAKGSLTGTFER